MITHEKRLPQSCRRASLRSGVLQDCKTCELRDGCLLALCCSSDRLLAFAYRVSRMHAVANLTKLYTLFSFIRVHEPKYYTMRWWCEAIDDVLRWVDTFVDMLWYQCLSRWSVCVRTWIQVIYSTRRLFCFVVRFLNLSPFARSLFCHASMGRVLTHTYRIWRAPHYARTQDCT